MRYQSPHGITGQSFRPPRMGSKGAVVANHTLAAQAGIRTLHRGGNAVDAAISVAFALGVAEPSGSSIGGDGFVMTYMKDKKSIEVANGTGAAPALATAERYSNGIPLTGILGTSVPGILDALLATHERHGLLPLSVCVEPAIELCEDGVPVSHQQAVSSMQCALLRDAPTSAEVFAPNGKWLKPGELRHNPNLAKTYRTIAEEGRDAFYEGDIAREIGRFSEECGGLLRYEDMKHHKVKWQEPISTTYRGRTVYEAPPNSSGHVLLQELNLFENFDSEGLGYLTSEAVHVMTECKKLAFADREAYMADPDFVDVPVEGMLNKEYSAERAKLIDFEHALTDDEAREGDPWAYMDRSPDVAKKYRRDGMIHYPNGSSVAHDAFAARGAAGSDTTHFCVVDRWGNAVGELQSIQMGYGSGLIAGNTGVLLNNRMTYWHLDPDHIDFLRPGQRVRHTMNPVMVADAPVEHGGNLELVCGTPGADTQVQTNFQVVTGVFDHGLTVAEAIEGPRWTHYQGRTSSTYPHTEANHLDIEDRVDEGVVESLRARGHEVNAIAPFAGAGSEGAIQVHQEAGTMSAASDPRRDGDSAVW